MAFAMVWKRHSHRRKQPEKRPGRPQLAFRVVPQALALVWRASPRFTLLNALLTILQGVLPAILFSLSKNIVDGALQALRAQTRAGTQHVFFVVAFWIALQVVSAVLNALGTLITSLQSDLLSHSINVQIITKASDLDLAYFENAQFYDKLENARREAGYRPGQMVVQLFTLLQQMITLLSVIGILASLSWWLTVLVIAASIPSMLFLAKYSRESYILQTRRAPEQRQLNYLGLLLTTDTPVKELRIFGLHNTLLERYRQIFAKFYRENRNVTARRTLAQLVTLILGILISGASYVYAVAEVIAGQITIGGFTLYYQAFQRSQTSVMNIVTGINSMYENALFLSNLFDFLAFAPELPVRPDPVPVPQPIREGIVLEHVSFKYPGTDTWVLEDISFAIRPGETVALVGANGAGKTTLVKLLTRLYDPTEGSITIDGIDLRDFDPAALRSRVGVIFQDYVKYQLTAGENIGFGRIEAMEEAGRIERAAVKAGADAVIAGLPQGYDTPLGRWFQDGQELSIGQWQKVALARAFMRDADLLILDEPTSSLDVRSEYEVFQAFGDLTEGKMAVLISHRFSTVRMAGRIVVIEDGRVIEDGSHDELLLRGGRYAELFDLQAASYR